MNHEYKAAKFYKQQYSICSQTLRNWADAGKVNFIRLHGDHGERRYLVSDIKRHMGITDAPPGLPKRRIAYARVSIPERSEELDKQCTELQRAYPNHELIRDVGLGVGFKRRGLKTLLDAVYKQAVGEVVIMHRDRLARVGMDLLEDVLQRMDVKLVVHCPNEENEEGKQEDLVALMAQFNAGGTRKRRSREVAEEEGDGEGKKVKEGERAWLSSLIEDYGPAGGKRD